LNCDPARSSVVSGQSSSPDFFEPVNFDFELADLLIKFRFESFFFLGVAFTPR